jgi:hypothetical protein
MRSLVISFTRRWSAATALSLMITALILSGSALETIEAQAKPGFEYRVLATTKTSTMEKELNEGAEAGFRFQSAMGGHELVAILRRTGD